MKRLLLSLISLSIVLPVFAEGYVSKYPLQMTNSSQKTKVYSSSGSLQGFVEPISGNKYQTYNKYHQSESKYSVKTVKSGSENKIYNKNTGSLQGYTRATSNGETKVYDKNHQYTGKYKQSGNNLKYYPKK